jgi:hypothetical protein
MVNEALSSMLEQERAWWSTNIVNKMLITFAPFTYLIDFNGIFFDSGKKDGVLASSRLPSAQPPLVTGLPGLCRTRLFAR